MCSCLKDCKQIDLVESNVNKRRETVLFDSTVRVPECSYLVRYHDSNRTKHIAMVMIWTFACVCYPHTLHLRPAYIKVASNNAFITIDRYDRPLLQRLLWST
jgi:hypothetical protein